MRVQQLLMALAYAGARATPVPAPQATGDTSGNGTVQPLTVDTWKNLGMEQFLLDWAPKVPASTGNAVQSLASSFGAPNFFCGLDKFCNAGQPNTPVGLPEWYALVAIQNWNSYMNGLNTAITFATAVMSLKLPGIVTDFYPDPKDDVTEMKLMTRVIAGAISIMPFTGAYSTAASSLSSTASFISTMLTPPEPTDKYLKWSQVADSVGTLVQDWQSAVSNGLQATIDAQVNATNGIIPAIADGKFLGVSGNITQADMQKEMYVSLEKYTIGLALQAQKFFVWRSQWYGDQEHCTEYSDAYYCEKTAEGKERQYILSQRDGYSNSIGKKEIMSTLVNKYGYTKEMITKGVADCMDKANGAQLSYPFGDQLPIDSSTECIFLINVCSDPGWYEGIISTCERLGVSV